jgi:hypothetical protein
MKTLLIRSVGSFIMLLLGLFMLNCEGKINYKPACTGDVCGSGDGDGNGNGCGEGNTTDICNNNFSADTFLPWEGGPTYYSKWTNGPSSDQNYFPLAVWLQQPNNAGRYKAIGINTFVGLSDGPTSGQLSSLATSEMPVFCDQDKNIFSDKNVNIIRGWLQQDEPDNAQCTPTECNPPITTDTIVGRYNTMKANDASRPVLLNLGQGVAWDGWWGRGNEGTNHPEDYAKYAEGGDILSYDIYPMNLDPSQSEMFRSELEKVSQSLWYVPYGIDRLRQWSDYKKPVWMALETTNINNNTPHPPTPTTTKAEVWMAIIHQARGIVYFCHNISPFDETGLLDDSTMSAAVKDFNAQITSLAPVLNTQSVGNGVTTSSSDSSVPVDTMLKRYGGYTYLFAVAMRLGSTKATFTLRDFSASASAEVIGESRNITVNNGLFQDNFTNYDVHIYKIR